MTAKQFENALNAFLKRDPFRPFTISLISGSRVEVHRPDAITLRDGLVVHVAPEQVTSYFDHESVVSLGSWADCDTPNIVEQRSST